VRATASAKKAIKKRKRNLTCQTLWRQQKFCEIDKKKRRRKRGIYREEAVASRRGAEESKSRPLVRLEAEKSVQMSSQASLGSTSGAPVEWSAKESCAQRRGEVVIREHRETGLGVSSIEMALIPWLMSRAASTEVSG